MKSFSFLLAFFVLTLTAAAQQNYFAYVQTENKQPFYVKIKEKVLSSSASGYVVIPKLSEGTYPLEIGFPKNQFPPQNITLIISNKDEGFLLKNYGEKGWGLYNIQSSEITMNGATAATKTNIDDGFTNVLSGATNTTIQPTVPKKVEEPIVKAPITTTVIKPSITTIKKIIDVFEDDGKTLVYVDATDTVTVFIPIKKAPSTKPVATEVVIEKSIETTQPDKKFINVDLANPSEKTKDNSFPQPINNIATKQPQATTVVIADKSTVSFNSDCKNNATEKDFLALRKRMASQKNDEAMVAISNKTFKTTCFSVEQIKNLSTLFLSDGGKYTFFDAAYAHTSDTQNFATLQSLLQEEYYITRFKAMIRN